MKMSFKLLLCALFCCGSLALCVDASAQNVGSVGIIVAIYAVLQVVESMALTPKLVGSRVGLHPVWIIFALLAAGVLFGVVGILLAVPVAAVIGVLVRFGLERYLASSLYSGQDGGDAPS